MPAATGAFSHWATAAAIALPRVSSCAFSVARTAADRPMRGCGPPGGGGTAADAGDGASAATASAAPARDHHRDRARPRARAAAPHGPPPNSGGVPLPHMNTPLTLRSNVCLKRSGTIRPATAPPC